MDSRPICADINERPRLGTCRFIPLTIVKGSPPANLIMKQSIRCMVPMVSNQFVQTSMDILDFWNVPFYSAHSSEGITTSESNNETINREVWLFVLFLRFESLLMWRSKEQRYY
ncbi:hypothetical protein CDAR_220681 [Caerostris darwini]|uniref:Uncharacterized protein n=1 Tax=Caerostris darwini TaxID=1538125 RepID=A0AAV4PF88_9ARAC|nr:hypothetical protein CDAR_220681 [Caerostris darwini]